MVVCPTDHSLQADVIFVVEGTAQNGAYINDLKANYIVPSLEYFNQGTIEEVSRISENTNVIYGIVVYQAADCLPQPSSDTLGPFTVPSNVINALDKLELIGSKGESCANIAEGIATALQCFEELQAKREDSSNVQKHCILVCSSPPYMLPVMECHNYAGKTVEQLAIILQEKAINLSIVSPKKIPPLYKLFEKAGGDLSSSQAKNYAKDPRHLVLLKGYHLKERPASPPVSSNANTLPTSSLPSESQMTDTAQAMGGQGPAGVSQGYGPPSGQGSNSLPQHPQQIPRGMMSQMPSQQQQPPAPPSYNMPNANRPQRWGMMPPQSQRQPYIPQNSVNTTQSSALKAQLTQPPSIVTAGVLNQYGQMAGSSAMSTNQQMNVMGSQQQQQQQVTNSSQMAPQNETVTSQAQANTQNPQARERHTIWQGLLEWIEKPKNATSPDQKITKHVPCQVSASSKDGEPELNADCWPPKLIMQLMPKPVIGSIGGAYLKNSKSVLFNLQNCEALESLTKVMISGFAGCVHFPSVSSTPCDIKVLILLYTAERRAYLGLIPNDQVAFVDRLRKVIQQQKSSQALNKSQQGGAASTSMGMQQGPSGMPNTTQQLVMPQTNAMAMAGGQITQNVVTSSAAAMLNRMRMPSPQPGIVGTSSMQRAPYETPFQLQVERQQNLEKINQLKQTLEAAQQQEQQYKSQLERISHLKTSQLQEALQMAQQQEMQYQRMANQGISMGSTPQQPRMVRPPMANNPGLRHLLQQQPQYRQMMGMQGNPQRPQMGQQMQNPGGNPQNTFDDTNNYEFM